jgi:hypothetical protein
MATDQHHAIMIHEDRLSPESRWQTMLGGISSFSSFVGSFPYNELIQVRLAPSPRPCAAKEPGHASQDQPSWSAGGSAGSERTLIFALPHRSSRRPGSASSHHASAMPQLALAIIPPHRRPRLDKQDASWVSRSRVLSLTIDVDRFNPAPARRRSRPSAIRIRQLQGVGLPVAHHAASPNEASAGFISFRMLWIATANS